MEAGHVFSTGPRRTLKETLGYEMIIKKTSYKDLQMLVKAIIDDQIIGHSYPMRFHRMTDSVIVITNFG
jgi:hypothetical protein